MEEVTLSHNWYANFECPHCHHLYIPYLKEAICPYCQNKILITQDSDFIEVVSNWLNNNFQGNGTYLPATWHQKSFADYLALKLFNFFEKWRTESTNVTIDLYTRDYLKELGVAKDIDSNYFQDIVIKIWAKLESIKNTPKRNFEELTLVEKVMAMASYHQLSHYGGGFASKKDTLEYCSVVYDQLSDKEREQIDNLFYKDETELFVWSDEETRRYLQGIERSSIVDASIKFLESTTKK